jgi:predicted phage terminase large subunit-like protein
MIDLEKEELAAVLKGSLLEFTKTFYPLLTGREFIISNPASREPHVITICRALTQCARLEIPAHRLIINVPPGHGKSTLLSMWVAWTLATYPDARFLYISYSKVLAAKHTETIKRIVSLAHYRYLFDIKIRHDSKAKDAWQTTAGGAVAAFGSQGAITGQDAGLPGLDRFSGALIIDDPHKPDEVHSDTMRQSVIDNYSETLLQRPRGINVPMIFIGQRLHEDDLAAHLIAGNDGNTWHPVILKSIDDAGNALYPEAFPLSMLKIRQERDIYVFASQHQQDPQPAGGALFKPDWFVMLDFEPKILQTFITADTAETDKNYNDATVFSFWGIYEIETMGRKTGEYGLHWIDCAEIRIEPKDLKDSFLDFWQDCMRHKMPPLLAAIEKKSTGVTLVSVLKELRGIQVRDIERTRASGSKTQRFLEIQAHVAARKISFTEGARHSQMCITHMSKITANNTHRHDDIADTCADAVKIALIDKLLQTNQAQSLNISNKLFAHEQSILKAQEAAYYGDSQY